ncbi:MAG: rhodanese-like domain-containing protein [Oscillospiraceae bacterium]|nr:rhodanese-like domain-containing protein [Oscillospiraceae bacterium]MCL2280148.1 rhodanese-like domain-containing protein [Oscillospiraceae bacterium]
MELTIEKLNSLNRSDYVIYDIRSAFEYQSGHIPGAVLKVAQNIEYDLPQNKKIIVYCKKGEISKAVVESLAEQGINAYHLSGGYIAWLLCRINENEKTEQEIEESIRSRFKRTIFSPFTKGLKTYKMIGEGDKIAVCISGGKDSMLMAKLFSELKRHDKFPFEIVYLVMDPGYAPENRELIIKNARKMGIPITMFETDIFKSVENVPKNACYLCARMRRGHLYKKAKSLGCNKIALGHHYDDVIETILMGMLWGAQIQTMMPKLKSDNYEGMELIRPMYLVREAAIKRFRDYHGLHFLQCACRFTDDCGPNGCMPSKRFEVKDLISEMKKKNPNVEKHIFKSVENVHLNAVIAYKQGEEKHHFLDSY